MRFKKILLLGFSESDLGPKYWERIDQIADGKILLPPNSPEVKEHLSTTDCLLIKLGAPVSKETMDSIPNLKYIGIYGTGYGRVDTEYASKKGITVCNIADYSTDGVAEFAFATILSYIRELSRARKQVSEVNYSEDTFTGTELRDKFFGVIGLGNIGGRTAEIASMGFKAETGYWSRTEKPLAEDLKIKYYDIETLIKKSDFLSLNLALIPETEGFLDARLINLIKPGAIVVNLAPMELVDLPALEKRLEKKEITFILDHSDEIPTEDAARLAKYPTCVVYPPIAYTTDEATLAKQGIFVGNLENHLKGSPTNKVN